MAAPGEFYRDKRFGNEIEALNGFRSWNLAPAAIMVLIDLWMSKITTCPNPKQAEHKTASRF